jgi:hypothetical protein
MSIRVLLHVDRIVTLTILSLFIGHALAHPSPQLAQPWNHSPTADCPSQFYKCTVIDQTGNGGIATFGTSVSINDDGLIAYIGILENGAEAIFVGDGIDRPRAVSVAAIGAKYEPAVQINNSSQIVARRRVSGAPLNTFIQQFDARADATTSATLIAENNNNFDAVLSYADINNNNQTVFVALMNNSSVGVLATPKTQNSSINRKSYNTSTPFVNSLRPQIADNGSIVALVQEQNGSPSIRKYEYTLNPDTDIDVATVGPYWSELGRSPGISDDGQIVVFYGDLTLDGAQEYNSKGNRAFNMEPGAGIFVSVDLAGGRQIYQIAGLAKQDQILQPWETWNDSNQNGQIDNQEEVGFSKLDKDSAISINATQANQRGVTIAYIAYDTQQNKGVYTTRFNFFGDRTSSSFEAKNAHFFAANFPALVVEAGQRVSGLDGAVTNLNLYDAVNNRDRGDIAFWVKTDRDREAVIKARSQKVVFIDFYPKLNYTNADRYTSSIFKKLGISFTGWHGNFEMIFNQLAPGRTFTQTPSAIQDDIVDLVQNMFDDVDPSTSGDQDVNVHILGRSSDTLPLDGPYTRVWVGFSGLPFDSERVVGATWNDPFNRSALKHPISGLPFYYQEQPIILAERIFQQRYGHFTTQNGQLSRPISLGNSGSSQIAEQEVKCAIATTIAHELAHSLGAEHLDANLNDLIMNAYPSSPFIDGAESDELRICQYFGALPEQLNTLDGYSLGDLENSGRRLAFAVGSDIDPSFFPREAPSAPVLQKRDQISFRLSAVFNVSKTTVSSAVLGVIPDGRHDTLPTYIELGSGDLATLLDTEILLSEGDEIFLVASTTGEGVDIFSIGSSYVDDIDQIDFSIGLSISTDLRLRSSLSAGSEQSNDFSLDVYQSTSSGFIRIGSIGADPVSSSSSITETSTNTVTPTNTSTNTSTPTEALELSLTPTSSTIPTHTQTPSATLTPTSTVIQQITPTSTWTRVPTRTKTPTPTNTPLPGLRTVIWITEGNGSWHEPANWSTGEVPQKQDQVVIPDLEGEVTITFSEGDTTVYSLQCAEHLLITDGILHVDAASTIKDLTLEGTIYSSNTFGGLGDITITGQMRWTTGTLNGSGRLTLVEDAVLTINSLDPSSSVLVPPHYLYRPLDTYGQTNWTGGTIVIQADSVDHLGVFNNYGKFNLQFDVPWRDTYDAEMLMYDQNGEFNNFGEFVKSAGAGVARLVVNFNNSGDVRIESGSLSLEGGLGSDTLTPTSISTGRIEGADGTSLILGAHQFQSSAEVKVPNVILRGHNIFGPGTIYEVTNNTTCNAWYVTARFENGMVVHNIGNSLTIDGCTVVFDQDSDLSINTLQMQNGQLDGKTNITTALLDWSGGNIFGSGTLNIPSDGTLIFHTTDNPNSVWLSRVFNNHGATAWQNGDLAIVYRDLSTLNTRIEELGSFNNHGLMTVDTDAKIEGPFNNTGTVTVYEGHLRLIGGGLHPIPNSVSSGVFNGADGTALTLQSHILIQGAVVSSFSDVTVNTVTFEAGSSFEAVSSTTVDYGPVVFDADVNLISFGSRVVVNSSLELNLSSVIFDNLDLYGIISGASDITINHSLNWFQGDLVGTGLLVISSEAILRFDTIYPLQHFNYLRNLNQRVENYGKIEWLGGRLLLGSDAVLNNFGLIDLRIDIPVHVDGTRLLPFIESMGGTFINHPHAEFVKSEGDYEALFFGEFQNAGTVRVKSGRLGFLAWGAQPGYSTGSFIGDVNTTLVLSGHVLAPSSEIHFAQGNIEFSNFQLVLVQGIFEAENITLNDGSVDFSNGAPVTVHTLSFTRGTLQGSSDLIVQSSFAWNVSGTMYGPGKLISQGMLSISTESSDNFNLRLDGRIVENSGIGIWDGGSIAVLNGGGIVNSGNLEIRGETLMRWCPPASFGSGCGNDGTPGTFINSGVLMKTGDGTLSFHEYLWSTGNNSVFYGGNVTVNNSGRFIIENGKVEFFDFVQTGGEIRLDGGTITSCIVNDHWTSYMEERCGNFEIGENSLLTGHGIILGNLINKGDIKLDQPEATLTVLGSLTFYKDRTIGGNFTQRDTGSIVLLLGGTTDQGNTAQLVIDQAAHIEGSLNVITDSDFELQLGDTFVVISFESDAGNDVLLSNPQFKLVNNSNSMTIEVVNLIGEP